MTKDREEAKKEIEEILAEVNREEKIQTQEEEIERLRKENKNKHEKIGTLERKLEKQREPKISFKDKFRGGVNEFIDKLLFDTGFRAIILTPVIAAAIGGVIYFQVSSINKNKQEYEQNLKQSIQTLTKSFKETVNQKDVQALKEYFMCENRYDSNNYNFMETIADNILSSNYQLNKFETSGKPTEIDRILGRTILNIQVNADLISNSYSDSEVKQHKILSGQPEMYCKNNKCVFLIKKEKKLCPAYSHQK